MQERECMIVRDLLPSYIEQLANDTSVSVVETHLQECKKCEKVYRELLSQYEEESSMQGKADKRFFRRLRRYRYQMLGGAIGIMLPFAALFLWYGIRVFQNMYLPNPVTYTEDIADYGKFEDYDGLSELALFPEKEALEEAQAEIVKYAYECDRDSLYQECQIYLECQYTENEYLSEKQRLQQITGPDTNLATVYTEKDFEYPAVYAMVNHCNEYALFLEEEHKVIYVYLQGLVDRRELYFSEDYLPLEYGQHGMEFKELEPYSIYKDKYDFGGIG